MSMRTFLLAAVALSALAAVGCGSSDPGAADEPPPVTSSTVDPAQLYEASTTVLDDADGPRLCVDGVEESLPPQCFGIVLVGWDWEAVEGEETASGATWGDYRVVGRFDGETFTVIESAPYDPGAADRASEFDFSTPCPAPVGGWVAVDPSRAADSDFAAGAAVAQKRPDYVALWVDYAGDFTDDEIAPRLNEGKPVLQIMNVVVTEDAAAAEADIREAWGGPLCVAERAGHTAQELAAIRAEAVPFIQDELGLRYLGSASGPVGLAAEIRVVADPGGSGQAAVDERFGPGLVRLVPALTPVAE
jgi:hypothetical protein